MNLQLDLTSVRAKLVRSQEHAQTVNNEILAWADRHPNSILQETSPDGTRHSLFLRVNEPPPFQRWSLIIADALANLRNALDHLVYAVACHEAAPNPPAQEKTLMFPIQKCRPDFDKAAIRQLGTISDPIRTAIEAAQPYNRPHPTLPPLLRILNDLNNRDKHRLLQMTFGSIEEGKLQLIGELQPGTTWMPVHCTDEIKDGTEIFAMVSDRPTPNMNFDTHTFAVVMAIRHGKRDPSEPDWTARSSFDALYFEISREVRRIVYDVAALVK